MGIWFCAKLLENRNSQSRNVWRKRSWFRSAVRTLPFYFLWSKDAIDIPYRRTKTNEVYFATLTQARNQGRCTGCVRPPPPPTGPNPGSNPQASQTIKIKVFETQRGKIHFMFLLVSYRHFLMSWQYSTNVIFSSYRVYFAVTISHVLLLS